ncbi:MAG: alkaline phosphatase family protein [Pseudomonadota bacterium]
MTLRTLLLWLCCSVAVAPIAHADKLPRPDHVVIVIEENRSYAQIIGNPEAPYINALAQRGVLFTRSYGVTHPSQPNYLALFSGSTHGVNSNACPLELSGPNLSTALYAQGLSFASYAESLPRAGDPVCVAGPYFRKHNPVANWRELADANLPFTAFPDDYTQLPTVALVIPDQRHDMHDGGIAAGDAWLKQNLDAYAEWAMQHNSLLIVTWDEDDYHGDNHVATLMLGPMLHPGKSAQRIDHYALLRTLQEMYGLETINASRDAKPVAGVWRKAGQGGRK